MQLTSIYAHLEPGSDEIRYIGKSDDPGRRLTAHLTACKEAKHYHANWLRSLQAQGLTPRLEIIAEVPTSEWQSWECFYIKYFREVGFRLTNATPGGDGTGSGPNNPMFGKRGSETGMFNRKHAAETILKMQVPKSLATRAKISAGLTGKSKSPAHCAALSAAGLRELHPLRGKPQSPELIEKRAAANRGGTRSLEQRARIGAAIRVAAALKREQRKNAI